MTPAPLPWVSVVIPIKDERDNLTPLTDQLRTVLDTQEETRRAPYEIIYVDDGSTDGSSELLDQLAARHAPITVLHFDRNYGKTAAMHAGLRQSTGQLVVTMDGDLQLNPADLPAMIPFARTYDLVCGWRKDRHDNLWRKFCSRLGNRVRNAVTHDGMHDTACEFKVWRRAVVETIPLFEGLHRFIPALALMYGFTVVEVPVRHYPRAAGVSKYSARNRLFKGLYDLFAVRWMQQRRLVYRIKPDGNGTTDAADASAARASVSTSGTRQALCTTAGPQPVTPGGQTPEAAGRRPNDPGSAA